MKKTFAIILSLLMLLPCFSFMVFAEKNIIYSGDVLLFNDDAESLEIAGKTISPVENIEFYVNIRVSDSSSKYNSILLNGKKIASLVDGINEIKLNSSELLQKDNEISVVLGDASAMFNDSVIYGTVNLDDVAIESVTFSGISFSEPEKMNCYMPIVDAAGTTVKTIDYEPMAIGDGWFADTGLGGSTPTKPLYIGFLFDNPLQGGAFQVKTTELADGKTKAVFKKSGKVVDEYECIIDNTAPVITLLDNGDSFKVDDITAVQTTLKVDGKKTSKINYDRLSAGKHYAYIVATDEAGNTSSKAFVFNVNANKPSVIIEDNMLCVSDGSDAVIYEGEILEEVYMLENRYGEYNQNYLRNDDEVLVSFNDKDSIVTSAIGNSLPYQSFVVNTEKAVDNKVMVSYKGETGNGSDIVLKAWNYKKESWDDVAEVVNGDSVTFEVDITDYSKDDKMRINAYPDIVYNGSNTILWNSDTQYYSRYEELNEMYVKVNEYAVKEYQSGEIGYCVHTGDLIDQAHMGDQIANAEYKFASKAQAILDDAKVPNGVVSGNHDICHEEADYSYYYKYFGESRYKDFDWYGGSLNNNMHHYDLVSIGAYDFVFLYFGTYKEAEADTIAWANAVCKAYPTRNVVICTHEYILPSGAYSGDRAEIIWNDIVVPNENVVMILCGHNTGVCDQMHQVGDSDRYVLEVLADYQFADLGAGAGNNITFIENNCTLDGEGFIRLMSFNEAGQVISNTYSPAADMYNFYPSYSDSFVYDVKMVPASRSIRTTQFDVITDCKEVGKVGSDGISLEEYEAVFVKTEKQSKQIYSQIVILEAYESNYKIPEAPEYSIPEPERVGIGGYEYVSENFKMNQDNVIPDSSLVENGFDLLKKTAKTYSRTSGSMNFKLSFADNNAVTLSHEAGSNNENWVTLANYFNSNNTVDVSKYNRLYFGVTSGKTAKWNIYVNFAGKEINFSQNKEISSLFGYVNETPSDIVGTWCGYIDLSEIITGNQKINSIYIVSATPGETVTFDYLFLGSSDAGKVRFITDENIVTAAEAKVGDKIKLPDSPYKHGYTFEGWYTAKEGGEKVNGDVIVTSEITELYARFSEKKAESRKVNSYNEELDLKQSIDMRFVFVIASGAFLVLVVLALIIKAIVSKNKVGK